MKTYWISIRSVKLHEFRKTLRYIKAGGATWHDIYIKLGELQQNSIKNLLKSFSAMVIYYLLLSSLGDQKAVSLTIQGVTASLPTAIMTLIASVAVYVITMQVQSTVMIIGLRAHEGAKLSPPGFSMGAYGLYNNQDEMELAAPTIRYGALTERFAVSAFLSSGLMIVVFVLLAPIAAL